MILRSLLVSAAVLCAALPLQAQSLPKALSVSDVEMLLGMDSPELVAEMVREECVSFPLDAAATARLRAARADEALLAVIRTACFTGAELVVESDPAGAEVLVGNQRVGTTPWAGRYSTGGQLRVEVKRQGRAHSTMASLQPGQRTRARFAFAADTVKVPGVRSVAEVARERSLAGQWRPTVPEPTRPAAKPKEVNIFVAWGATSAAIIGYCVVSLNCGADDGGPLENLAFGVGISGVIGYLPAGIIASSIDRLWKSSHEREKARHAEWTRAMAEAQSRWIESHPDVLSSIAQDRAARAEAQDHNARIRARNAAQAPVRVTTEMLPGRLNR